MALALVVLFKGKDAMHKIIYGFFYCGIISTAHYSFADNLVFYNWDDYISPTVIDQFESETGHTVEVLVFDRDNERDELIASQATSGIDLVLMNSISAKLFGKNNYLVPLTEAFQHSRDHLDSKWRGSCGQYAMPYLWGTLGIVYRKDKVIPPPTSWASLLTPIPAHQKHINMQLDSLDTLVPALKILGLSINTENIDDLKAAYKLLVAQKEQVLSYEYVVSYNARAQNKDRIYLALAYSGDQLTLEDDKSKPQWDFVVPKEGTAIWIDCIGILSSSAKKKAATAFINFINRPKIAALNAQELWVATTNLSALQHVSDEFLEDNKVFPSAEMFKNSEFYKELTHSSTRLRNRIIHQLGHKKP